ncbi:hypothetical protein JQ615_01275 [Bradyrhizobium jicamae]|uniref:CBS domain-containing protein n=1 Tax=Bradyrhizobium jicamae TaxID=280332 RepID=A0ABS5FB59_9BRAD|nr:hypothetical protein [Bradyrhizobium jicamae]MBR0794013.1 hypothetical protein [Bradyrhizobium jicamae]
MGNRWASGGLSGGRSVFTALHDGLTVDLIATHTNDLRTCTPHELVEDVLRRNPEDFDFLPVVNEASRFVGLFHAAAHRERRTLGTVWQCYVPISEDFLLGADASILEFVLDADEKPCRLVISGTKVVGLVSLSDLQRLPVRAALFALITGLEMTMADLIRTRHAKSEEWMRFLTASRQAKIEEEYEKANCEDGYVDTLLFTQFCDKRDIIIQNLPEPERTSLRAALGRIESLRNGVAHANEYASTPTQAKNVCKVIRELLCLVDHFREQLPGA